MVMITLMMVMAIMIIMTMLTTMVMTRKYYRKVQTDREKFT